MQLRINNACYMSIQVYENFFFLLSDILKGATNKNKTIKFICFVEIKSSHYPTNLVTLLCVLRTRNKFLKQMLLSMVVVYRFSNSTTSTFACLKRCSQKVNAWFYKIISYGSKNISSYGYTIRFNDKVTAMDKLTNLGIVQIDAIVLQFIISD